MLLRKRKNEKTPVYWAEDRETHRRFYEKLGAPLRRWQWDETVTEEINNTAKEELKAALTRGKELVPDAVAYGYNDYHREPLEFTLPRLMELFQALAHKRWDIACHELHDVAYYCPIQDQRVLLTVIGFLSVALENDGQWRVLPVYKDPLAAQTYELLENVNANIKQQFNKWLEALIL